MSLKGKVIAVTGAASGIGQEVARLASAGAAILALADSNGEGLRELARGLRASGTNVLENVIDVSSGIAVREWVKGIKDKYGRLDGAANLAGIEGKHGLSGKLQDTSDEEWDLIISVNLTGLMYCMRSELEVMEAGAAIVNAASIVGIVGRPGMAAYAASKHGVIGLTKSVARECGERGIRVNAIAPGSISTPMLQRVTQTEKGNRAFSVAPLGRNGSADEVAKVVLFLLSDDASYVSGSIYLVDGGLIA